MRCARNTHARYLAAIPAWRVDYDWERANPPDGKVVLESDVEVCVENNANHAELAAPRAG